MAEGSGAYKWHEWEAVFPENNARGPRGVGFQENADCFPVSRAPFPFVPILHPPISLQLPFPSLTFSPRPALPCYQSSTSSVVEMYNPPFAYECVRISPRWLLLPPRPLSGPYLAVPTASCRVATKIGRGDTAHRSY